MEAILLDAGNIILGSVERAPWGWALLASVLLGYKTVWPIISAQLIDAHAKSRGEKRHDLHTCQERIDGLEKRLASGEEKTRKLELKFVGVLTGYRILEADIEFRDPKSMALVHARRAMLDAYQVSDPPPPDMEATLRQI